LPKSDRPIMSSVIGYRLPKNSVRCLFDACTQAAEKVDQATWWINNRLNRTGRVDRRGPVVGNSHETAHGVSVDDSPLTYGQYRLFRHFDGRQIERPVPAAVAGVKQKANVPPPARSYTAQSEARGLPPPTIIVGCLRVDLKTIP
jgi:hypothetical protein